MLIQNSNFQHTDYQTRMTRRSLFPPPPCPNEGIPNLVPSSHRQTSRISIRFIVHNRKTIDSLDPKDRKRGQTTSRIGLDLPTTRTHLVGLSHGVLVSVTVRTDRSTSLPSSVSLRSSVRSYFLRLGVRHSPLLPPSVPSHGPSVPSKTDLCYPIVVIYSGQSQVLLQW